MTSVDDGSRNFRRDMNKSRSRDRISVAFGKADSGQLETLIEWIRGSLAENTARIYKTATLMFLFVALFEVGTLASIDELSIGPLKLTQISSLMVFVPTIVAYFFLEIMILDLRDTDIVEALNEALSLWNHDAKRCGVAELISPASSLLWAVQGSGMESWRRRQDTFSVWLKLIVAIFVAVGLLAFWLHAYITLFGYLGGSNLLVWTNLSITLALVASAIGQASLGVREAVK